MSAAPTSAPSFKMPARQAINLLAEKYLLLVREANAAIAKAKAEKRRVPEKFVDAYHRAVNDYLKYGRQLIESLAKQRLTLEQVVFDSSGKPVPGPGGQAKTIRLVAPLRPPVFPLDAGTHPSVTRVQGESMVGVAFLAIPVVAFAIKATLVSGAAIILSKTVLDKLVILFQGHPPPDTAKTLEAGKAAGLSPEANAALAKQQLESFEKSQANRGPSFGTVAIAGVAVVGLAVILPQIMKKGG